MSTIELDAPGLFTNSSSGREREFGFDDPEYRSADTAIIDEESGLIIGGGGGLWVLDPDSESLNMLFSSTLFDSAPSRSGHRVMYAPGRNEAFVISATRIVAVDLSIFDDVEPGQALDYDDPEVRLAIDDKVRWSFMDPTITHLIRWFGTSIRRNPLQWHFSADESVLYVTAALGEEARVMIVENDTLRVPRLIFGELIAYNVHVDQLVLRAPDGLALVDASAMQDVAEVEIDSDLGVAPVPGKGEYYVAYTKLAADDMRIPFIAVIDDEGEILSDQRAREHLGLDYDPDPGAPRFDSTGEYFVLGDEGYRLLDDGSFEFLGFPVPWGDAFMERVDCNWHNVFDPVNRYAIWFDCEGWDHHPGAMAIISTDRGNIPISIRVNSGNVLLHPPSGRAFVIDDDNDVSVVHYADPMAADRPSFTRLVAGEEHVGPGQECGVDEPCPFEEVCVARTDTALSGNCKENERNPFLIHCGGLTRIECDDGYTCELINPTNPDSAGFCRGSPDRDYENHGPRCGPDGECVAGFSCNDNGRCVPRACMSDEDCGDGEVCGMVHDVGRVCVMPGPLGTGEICGTPEDCLSGVCMDTLLGLSVDWQDDDGHVSGWFDSFPLCTTPCVKNVECPEGSNCVHIDTPWPVCVDEGWVLSGDGTQWPLYDIGWTFEHCSPACGEDAICTQHYESPCQVGFLPGPLSDTYTVPCSSDEDCAVPGSCVPLTVWRDDGTIQTDQVCGFPCSQSSDCPWDADCINGTCNVTWSRPPEQAYYCQDGAGCSGDEWCLSLDFFPNDPFHCVEEQPCYYDSECEDGLECFGICTQRCRVEWDAPADGCGEGLQCVYEGEESLGEGICMPPVCDCPDTGGSTAICPLDTKDCSFRQTCAPALCDGTHGPMDPNDPEDRTCCRPGNPCGLTQEEICQCPPTCDFWTAHYCCHHGDICPSETNPVSLCPEGYECQLTDHGDSVIQAYGFVCVAGS